MIDQIRIQTPPESLVRYSTKLTDQSGPTVTHHLKTIIENFVSLIKPMISTKQDTHEEFCRYLISKAMRLHGQFSSF